MERIKDHLKQLYSEWFLGQCIDTNQNNKEAQLKSAAPVDQDNGN
jgi:hypothetical protein